MTSCRYIGRLAVHRPAGRPEPKDRGGLVVENPLLTELLESGEQSMTNRPISAVFVKWLPAVCT